MAATVHAVGSIAGLVVPASIPALPAATAMKRPPWTAALVAALRAVLDGVPIDKLATEPFGHLPSVFALLASFTLIDVDYAVLQSNCMMIYGVKPSIADYLTTMELGEPKLQNIQPGIPQSSSCVHAMMQIVRAAIAIS